MEKQEGHPKSELGPAYEKGSLRDERCDDDSNPDDDSDSDLRNSLTDVTQQNTDSGEGTHSKRNDDEIKEIVDLIRNETNFLCVWRLIMLLLILATYVLVITGAYLYLQNVQNVSTDQSYIYYTNAIHASSHSQFHEMQLTMADMAQTITTAGISTSGTFPFVRVPFFEVSAGQARELSGVEIFTFNPIVTTAQRDDWNAFSQLQEGWYDESKAILLTGSDASLLHTTAYGADTTPRSFIWRATAEGGVEEVPPTGPFAPVWHCSPPPFSPSFINYNMLSEQYVIDMLPVLIKTRDGLVSGVDPTLGRLAGLAVDSRDHESFHDQYVTSLVGGNAFDRPHSVLLRPVVEGINDDGSKMVGFLSAVIPWDRYMANLLPEGVNDIVAVLKNTCNQSFTYVLKGPRAEYLGPGDLHDTSYDVDEVIVPLTQYKYNTTQTTPGHCMYSIFLYSSTSFEDATKKTNLPAIAASAISVIFVIMIATFCLYDRFVKRRNDKVVNAAVRSNAIIASLFPKQVRDRLFAEKEGQKTATGNSAPTKSKLKTMMHDGSFLEANSDDKGENNFMYKTKPIADLFPETTILFADISGFTAWSSVREPSQVFILLETLYRAFDDIAKKRRVFKVETIGDCYVAVTGLPDPRKDHAVAMARFARDILFRSRFISRKLEVTLGPDTGDLAMRIGMHSGPVTAGVLRGERSRFQLFGDTMNTAARMEHTGVRDRIQMSQETADLLVAAGKESWLSPRQDVVNPKGKGEMQTYWLELSSRGDNTSHQDTASSSGGSSSGYEVTEDDVQPTSGAFEAMTIRLIEWNVDVLLRLLKQIVARRKACPLEASELVPPDEARFAPGNRLNVLDEVKEIITLPKFKEAINDESPDSISLHPVVVQQLHDYVYNIAASYRENPFHNFEHASHVSMSVVKLLSRIVAPHDTDDDKVAGQGNPNTASTLHDHTYGITSDPLTQFACVLSALIHDVDHSGAPNAQLVVEQAEIAKRYNNKSVAEQNSVDLAWNLLMQEDYTELRRTIYESDDELQRFRQLVVNSVMATDIVDKELKTLRNLRWDRAFSRASPQSFVGGNSERETVQNRKATIVIEHLIQASDVAHTMQHWHIYRKWNERFFVECYQAYVEGRAAKNPAESWYEGEIGFFDCYIIPLSKKLKDCGVFGVSSDEYWNYATHNRHEWEVRGREIVNEMVEQLVCARNANDERPAVAKDAFRPAHRRLQL